jgi:hypothetical protein
MAPVLAELRSLLDTLNLFAADERGPDGRGDGVCVLAAHRSGLRSSLGFGVDDGATNKPTEGAHARSSALSRSAHSVASKSAGDGATAVARERRHRLHEQPSGVHAQAQAGAAAERTAEAPIDRHGNTPQAVRTATCRDAPTERADSATPGCNVRTRRSAPATMFHLRSSTSFRNCVLSVA